MGLTDSPDEEEVKGSMDAGSYYPLFLDENGDRLHPNFKAFKERLKTWATGRTPATVRTHKYRRHHLRVRTAEHEQYLRTFVPVVPLTPLAEEALAFKPLFDDHGIPIDYSSPPSPVRNEKTKKPKKVPIRLTVEELEQLKNTNDFYERLRNFHLTPPDVPSSLLDVMVHSRML